MTIRTSMAAAAALSAGLIATSPASAQYDYMSDIIMVAFNYCPVGTASTDGQIQSINSNQALFSLIGTTYGGDGVSTYALPDFRSRQPTHVGQGNGLSPLAWGQRGGGESVTLTVSTMPSHAHSGHMRGSTGGPAIDNPTNASSATFGQSAYSVIPPDVDMLPNTAQTDNTGNNTPVPIRDPYLTIRFCMVENGIYPSRN